VAIRARLFITCPASETYGVKQETDVIKGQDLLQVEYVATEHSPFNPRVIVGATFIVQ
jgi:hypothetical protein